VLRGVVTAATAQVNREGQALNYSVNISVSISSVYVGCILVRLSLTEGVAWCRTIDRDSYNDPCAPTPTHNLLSAGVLGYDSFCTTSYCMTIVHSNVIHRFRPAACDSATIGRGHYLCTLS